MSLPVFDRTKSFATVVGKSPAAYYQAGEYFTGDGLHLTWAQAAGEARAPAGAADTQRQSIAALSSMANRPASSKAAAAPVVTDTIVVGAQPSADDAVAAAAAALNEDRSEDAPSIEELSATQETEETDRDAYNDAQDLKHREYENRVNQCKVLPPTKLKKMCRDIVKKRSDRGDEVDGKYPLKGPGSQTLNAQFVAQYTYN